MENTDIQTVENAVEEVKELKEVAVRKSNGKVQFVLAGGTAAVLGYIVGKYGKRIKIGIKSVFKRKSSKNDSDTEVTIEDIDE